MVVATTLAALVVGFGAGLFGLRIKSRWCPRCGHRTYPPVYPGSVR
jgi:hypothetical protein